MRGVFRVDRIFQTDGVRLWFVHPSSGWVGAGPDQTLVAAPVTFDMKPVDPDAAFDAPPTLELDSRAKQSLMDELWFAGVRPTGREDPNSVIQAKNEHIADLRKALFEVLPTADVKK